MARIILRQVGLAAILGLLCWLFSQGISAGPTFWGFVCVCLCTVTFVGLVAVIVTSAAYLYVTFDGEALLEYFWPNKE